MAWQTMSISELKRRAVFLILTLTIMSANLAYCVEVNPIEIGQQAEKLGIVGVLVVVIVIQAAGLLYLMRLIGTKFYALLEQSIKTNEHVIEAIDHCKAMKQ